MGNQKGKVLAPPAATRRPRPAPGPGRRVLGRQGAAEAAALRAGQPGPSHWRPRGAPALPGPTGAVPLPADTSVVAAESPRPPAEALFLTLSHLVPEGHVLTSPVGKPMSSVI